MGTVKTHEGHNVPKGATHYIPDGNGYHECFMKAGNDQRLYCYELDIDAVKSWRWSLRFADIGLPIKFKLPQEPEQFVPVVGEECEVYCAHNQGEPDKDMAWRETTIFSIVGAINNEGLVTFKTGWSEQWYGETDVCHLRKFRPIKTEREKVCEAAGDGLSGEFNRFVIDNVIGQLYDAGMLTMPNTTK